MTEEIMTTDPDSGAQKGVKLERFDLIPVRPLEMLAKHYGVGAQKYAERQWEGGYAWWKSFGAACRHLFAFWRGEDVDADTGSPHLICVVWHCFALLEFGRTHPEKDMRVVVHEKDSMVYVMHICDVNDQNVSLRTFAEAASEQEAITEGFREWVKIYPEKDARLISVSVKV